jgi:hypothetical protein
MEFNLGSLRKSNTNIQKQAFYAKVHKTSV